MTWWCDALPTLSLAMQYDATRLLVVTPIGVHKHARRRRSLIFLAFFVANNACGAPLGTTQSSIAIQYCRRNNVSSSMLACDDVAVWRVWSATQCRYCRVAHLPLAKSAVGVVPPAA
jgi:hypothetical protein